MTPERLWWYSSRLYHRGHRRLAYLLKLVNYVAFKAVLPPQVRLERDITLWHRGLGVVVHPNVVIGHNVHIGHLTTIAGTDAAPMVIEDDVKIASHALLIPKGDVPLVIGRGSIVGGGSVVTKSVPAGVTVAGNPARETPGSIELRMARTERG